MMRFITLRFYLLIFILGVVCKVGISQSIFTNPITAANPSLLNPYTTGQIIDANITVSGIGRGSGILAASAMDRYAANNWSLAALDVNDYFEFTLTPTSGVVINFTSFVFTCQRTSTAPNSLAFRSSVDGYTANIGAPTVAGGTIILSALAYQGISTAITFRLYGWGGTAAGGVFSINDFTFNGFVAPLTPKYYRSKNPGGEWKNITTWESSLNNSAWFDATLAPSSGDKTITIGAGHIVTVSTSSLSLDETIINGTLKLLTGGIININHPAVGIDMDIQNNALFQLSSTDLYTTVVQLINSPVINVATGGKILIGDGLVNVGVGYETFATSALNTWNNNSVFEWNSPTAFIFSNNTYFPNAFAAVIPKFIVSTVTGPVGGSSNAAVKGLLLVNTSFSFTGSGAKTIRDGIAGSATLTMPSGIGTVTIDGSSPILGGSNLIIATDKNINIPNGITVPLDSMVKVMPDMSGTPQFASKGNNNFTVNGTIDITTVTIANPPNGKVIINGILKTANLGGLEGGTITSSSITQVNTLSTIEYNAASGIQIITGSGVLEGTSPYYNIIFSGGSIKLPGNAVNVNTSGSVKITGATTTVDATSNNIGRTTLNTTGFVMDGGKFILGTAETLPLMDGVYSITGGVIQYTNSPTIRGSKTYNAIEIISGANVLAGAGDITLRTNGSFLVKSGGTFTITNNKSISASPADGTQSVTVESGGYFKCGSNQGFNGYPQGFGLWSSIDASVTNVNLNAGSTVEYTYAGNQPITNANGLVYGNLLISGTSNKTAPTSILTIQGNLTKSGTSVFLHNGGTVLLNGAAQSFAGLTYNNLILSNGNTKTTSGTSTLIDSLKISTSTTLNLAGSDSIILHSDALKTARVGQVDGSIAYPGAGRFVVERYISSKRAWRFLSVPTNTTQKIHDAWQEGQGQGSTNQTTPAGYGTQITDKVTPDGANGFDYYSPNGPSVKTFNPATNIWVGINSTITTAMQTTEGLMTFVRGDRTAQGFYATPTPTVLRTYGPIYTGTRAFIPITAGKFASIGNPYPSPIDMRTIQRTFGQVDSFFYVWDPKLTSGLGFGAFQTFTQIGGNYYPTPGGGSYPTTGSYNLIASGQAFFVHGKTSGSGGQFTMKETDKNYNDVPNAFRPENTLLRNNLYLIDADSSASLVDGVLNVIGDTYSNSVDEKDAIKIANFAENLAIKKEDKLLSVEKRHSVIERDTIFYNLTKVKLAPYRFEINADNFSPDNIKASFEDVYLDTKTPVDLKGTTMVNFKITSDSASWNPDRFRMIFEKINNLPEPGITALITVYPNPVKNNTINLYLVKQPKNTFQVNLINISGQVIYTKKISHEEGSSSEIIYLKKSVPKGNYLLNITDEHNNKRVITITK